MWNCEEHPPALNWNSPKWLTIGGGLALFIPHSWCWTGKFGGRDGWNMVNSPKWLKHGGQMLEFFKLQAIPEDLPNHAKWWEFSTSICGASPRYEWRRGDVWPSVSCLQAGHSIIIPSASQPLSYVSYVSRMHSDHFSSPQTIGKALLLKPCRGGCSWTSG